MTAHTILVLTRVVHSALGMGALVAAVACSDGSGLPTSPTSNATGTERILAADPTAPASGMAAPARMLLTKTCGADAHCTVQSSTYGPLPEGSDIFYTGPLLADRTTSGILVTTPSGDTASGHCSLSYRSLTGTCVLTGGTGALAGVHASVKVTTDLSDPNNLVYTWEGRYHFAPAEAH